MTVSLNPKITQAGLALFPNAALPGFQVTLTHVALGTGRYVPGGGEVALRGEVARFPITSGTNPSPRTVQVGLTITDTDPQGRSANGKGICEVGFYSGNTLFAIWSQDAEPLFYKSAAFDIPMAYTLDVSLLPASSVTVTVDASKAGIEAFILAHEAKADPHPQYLTWARGDPRYAPLGHVSAPDPHPQYLTHSEGTDAFLHRGHIYEPDPHPQYLTPSEGNDSYAPIGHLTHPDPHPQYVSHAEGNAWYANIGHLTDADPHPQYMNADRGDQRYTGFGHVGAANPHAMYLLRTDAAAGYAPLSHLSAGDPHPQYLTPAEGNDAYAARSHTWEANPHPQYMQRSDSNAAYIKQGGVPGQYANNVYMGYNNAGSINVQVDQTNLGAIAFQGWVNDIINNIVGAAPATLDQLGELARAIGSDPNFAVTMANQLAGKERKFDVGVRLACANWAAPVGWSTVSDDSTDNRMMRVVASNGSGAGGVHNPVYNNLVPAHTHGFTTGAVSSDHSHGVYDPGHAHGGGQMVGGLVYAGGNSYIEEGQSSPNIAKTYMEAAYTGISLGGISANHSHSGGTDNGSSQTNWEPRYLNIIIIQKN